MSSRNLLSSVPENQSLSFSSKQKQNYDAADATNEVTREEVESMKRQVLPDEIDSVDQSLDTFQGREDELLQSDHQRQEDSDHQLECHVSNPQGGRGGESDGDSFSSDLGSDNNELADPSTTHVGEKEMDREYYDEDENDYTPTDYKVPAHSMRNRERAAATGLTTQDGCGVAPPMAGKKTVALVKLRVWDPASPKAGQLEFLTSAHVMLPNEKYEEDPKKTNEPEMSSRPELCVGTVVGIQLEKSPFKRTASSATLSSLSVSKDYEWRVGNSINLHHVKILSSNRLPELYYQIENNYSTLRELVMDGWPSETVGCEETELVLEALGSNTSIKRLSMRYSNVTDDIASHCALALVKNETLTQLSLEGNNLTNLSVKNFYSVLKTNNVTLRLLDLSQNSLIDDDVEQSLDQFIEQRAFKRALTNKADKAKRKARGLPPAATLDDSDDEGAGQVTVVCPQSVIDEVVDRGDGTDGKKEGSQEQHQLNQSDRDREAFDSFTDAKLQPLHDFSRAPVTATDQSSYGSRNSSISSLSVNRPGTETVIVTAMPHDQTIKAGATVFDNGARASQRKNTPADGAVIKNSRQPPRQLNTVEVHKYADDPVGTNPRNPSKRMNTAKMQTSANDAVEPGLKMSSQTQAPKAVSPPVNHGTRSSKGSHSSLELSVSDYIDDKANERELRRQHAAEGDAVGAHYVHEVAFARQNRAGRSRMRRTESQRRARLAQLTEGGDIPATNVGADVAGNTPIEPEPIMNADIERADNISDDMDYGKSLDGEAGGKERVICGIVALLFVALTAMVIARFAR